MSFEKKRGEKSEGEVGCVGDEKEEEEEERRKEEEEGEFMGRGPWA